MVTLTGKRSIESVKTELNYIGGASDSAASSPSGNTRELRAHSQEAYREIAHVAGSVRPGTLVGWYQPI
jgi:hypothetical protein